MKKKLPLKKGVYFKYFLQSLPAVFAWKLFRIKPNPSRFLEPKQLDLTTSDAMLKNAILSGEPFAAIRIGAVEMGAIHNYERIQLGLMKSFKPSVRYSMKNNAGFFPTDDKNLTYYAKHFIKDAPKTDLLGISGLHMEKYMAKRYFSNAEYLLYEAFEPLRGTWIQALEGKKVLVISPFADQIKQQYQQKDELFPEGVLPAFELITYPAVISLGKATPEYPTWFEALDAMKVDILKLDFDLALIGAGAYGSHLAWFIKSSLRKPAIQTGGATQTLFGLLGRRWEKRPHVSQYVNDFWKRPERKPDGYEDVEHGAYW
jgi:hypothetical protein